jgi:hypothetical protein
MDSCVTKISLLGFVLIVFALACTNTNSCTIPKLTALRCGFYTKDTNNINQPTAIQNGLVRYRLPNDTAISLVSATGFSMSLPQHTDSVIIIFQLDADDTENFIDTLCLYYQRNTNFISVACGFETFFELENVKSTRHVIDSVLINNKSVNNQLQPQHLHFILKS